MSTTITPQVLESSVDTTGLSVVTSTMTAEATRQGTIYNHASLAAGVPVHCHRLQDGNYLVLFRSRWVTANAGTHGPQSYSNHAVSTDPSWVKVTPSTGQAGPVSVIPTLIESEEERTLNAAVSRVDYLYTIGTLGSQGHIGLYRVSRDRSLLLQTEEALPVVNGVTFGYGGYIDGNYLVVVGRDAEDKVYLSRRRWGRIGTGMIQDTRLSTDPRYQEGEWTPDSSYLDSEPWFYRGSQGWSANPADLAALTTYTGDSITSTGPVSMTRFRTRMWMSTVVEGETEVTAQMYSSSREIWGADGDPVSLGETADYLGGTVFFQPVPYNPALLPEGASSALPYVKSVRLVEEDDESITTSWALWPANMTGSIAYRSAPTGSDVFTPYTTGSRPSAASLAPGARIYDQTLSKPLWSDGAVWRDAAGTAV